MAKTDFSPDAMRARFWEASAQRDAMRREMAPLQKRRDVLAGKIAALEEDIRPVNQELKAAVAPIAEFDNEIAALARALGGKTGEPPKASARNGKQ